MIFLRISDKSLTPLVTFLEGQFSELEYEDTVGEIGQCSFRLDLGADKVTQANLKHYNRVEVVVDGTVRWTGYIAKKRVDLNTVKVRCKGLIGILKHRLVGADCSLSGPADWCAQAVLNAINAEDPTGISFGEHDASTLIDMRFNYRDAFSVIKTIADAVGAQFEVTPDRKLNFKTTIGQDRSADIVLRYNINPISQANILKFEVDDDGDDVVTKAYGKSGTFQSTQEDSTGQAQYGVLEAYRDVRVANVQADVDGLTQSLLRGPTFEPTIELVPSVPDTFSAGDVVKVQLTNKLIAIDGNYQIMSKTVRVVGRERFITIKVNGLTQDIVKKIRDIESRLSLLETNV